MYCQTFNTTFFTSKIRVILFFWFLSTGQTKQKRTISLPVPFNYFSNPYLPSVQPCASSFADDHIYHSH